MSNCQHCRVLELSFNCFLNQEVSIHIDVGSGFVKYQNLTIF